MRRLLREANVQTVPVLPETEQAQDLLAPLREAKIDQRSTHKSQQTGASFGMTSMASNDNEAASPVQHQLASGMINLSTTSPIQPSVFPPLSTRYLKPPSLGPRCSSFPLPSHQSGPLTMPLHPRIANDPCASGSSSGGGASPAIGDMDMSMLGAQWPSLSRTLPTSAPYATSPGYQTPLTPSSTLTTPGDYDGVPNWTWMYGSEFGLPGTDCNNEQSGSLNLDWNDANRVP